MKMYIELSQKICFSDFKIYIYDFNKSFKSQCIEKTYKEDF